MYGTVALTDVFRGEETNRVEDPRLTQFVTVGDKHAALAAQLTWVVTNCPKPRQLTHVASDIAQPVIEAEIQSIIDMPMNAIQPREHVGRVFTFDVTPRLWRVRSEDPLLPVVLCAPPAMRDTLQAFGRLVNAYLHLSDNLHRDNLEWAKRMEEFIPVLVKASVGNLSKAELAYLLYRINDMQNRALQGRIWPAPSPWRRYMPVIACGIGLLAFYALSAMVVLFANP